ncbi:beta-lactamase-like protein [Irpex lacteus]|nr:beta-lactamase-like protein [Irpex lacteus]
MPTLKQVDKLSVQFIVDNSTEWFLKVPPGFTHEMKYHLTELKPVIDPLTGAPIIDAENYCCGAHGFSALIHTQTKDDPNTHLTLFDTGPDSKTISRNLSALQIPTEKIDRVVLSHWHADHSGGILTFLRERHKPAASRDCSDPKACVLDLHPDRPIARGIAPGGKIVARLPDDPTFEQIEELGGVVEKHTEGHVVADGTVYVSGEIPRITIFEQGLLGAVRWKEGEWVPEENIMDERYAAVDVTGKGLVVFSACSHAGIVNVVKDAINALKRPVYMIIGGLHLCTPDLLERIAPTVDFLAYKLRPAPTYVLPMHCSGFDCKVALERAFGEGCVPAGTGVKVDINGDSAAEARMFPPAITAQN